MARHPHGEVVRIRVSPPDVMAAIDVVDTLGLYIHGMSLSQCISVALKVTLESCRHSKLIETREGWEYVQMLKRFPQSREESIKVKGRQIAITKAFEEGLGENNRVPPLNSAFVEPDPETHPNLEVRRLFRELKEMDARRAVDPLNFDQQLYDQLNSELCKLI